MVTNTNPRNGPFNQSSVWCDNRARAKDLVLFHLVGQVNGERFASLRQRKRHQTPEIYVGSPDDSFRLNVRQVDVIDGMNEAAVLILGPASSGDRQNSVWIELLHAFDASTLIQFQGRNRADSHCGTTVLRDFHEFGLERICKLPAEISSHAVNDNESLRLRRKGCGLVCGDLAWCVAVTSIERKIAVARSWKRLFMGSSRSFKYSAMDVAGSKCDPMYRARLAQVC